MKMSPSIAFLVVALFTSGRSHYPVNTPVAAVDSRTGCQFQNTASLMNSAGRSGISANRPSLIISPIQDKLTQSSERNNE